MPDNANIGDVIRQARKAKGWGRPNSPENWASPKAGARRNWNDKRSTGGKPGSGSPNTGFPTSFRSSIWTWNVTCVLTRGWIPLNRTRRPRIP